MSGSARKGAITLVWTDHANNETSFRIERSAGGGAFIEIAQTGPNGRTYGDQSVVKNRVYSYRVRAFNADGSSAYSNTSTVTAR